MNSTYSRFMLKASPSLKCVDVCVEDQKNEENIPTVINHLAVENRSVIQKSQYIELLLCVCIFLITIRY